MFDEPPVILCFFVVGLLLGFTFRDTADDIIEAVSRWFAPP